MTKTHPTPASKKKRASPCSYSDPFGPDPTSERLHEPTEDLTCIYFALHRYPPHDRCTLHGQADYLCSSCPDYRPTYLGIPL